MWLITKDGFYSVVENRDDPTKVIVRARVLEDITRASQRLGTSFWVDEHADYPFRISCGKDEWAAACAALAEDIDYDNFKNTVLDNARHFVYLKVWETLLSLDYREALDDYDTC